MQPPATAPSQPRSGSTGEAAAPLQVGLIPALSDNYVAVLHDGRRAAVVDPAEAEPVRHWLEGRGLELEAVLQTHHHHDHIGGTPELLRRWPAARVVAAAADRERIPFQSEGVREGDRVALLGETLEVLEVPAHTRAHIAFLRPAGAGGGSEPGDLYCGDTLFAGGCGRLFEGTPAQMHQALQRFAALPGTTRVWCAHEYTATNLRWAAHQRPDDGAIARRLQAVEEQRHQGLATIPSTIAEERATNLFMRAADAAELAALRESRNHWQG
ncbi:MAG: hydroxyacylglutathione hydrolase [Cyanobacteriota bacterium]|nr:hydroxyacylglutathione hydrolase [Cyanobacteriota bacterium]